MRRISSKHHGGFCCLNCLHSFRTENKLTSHEKVCKTEHFSGIGLSSEKGKILELNQYMKSDKADRWANSPGDSSKNNIPCGYSMTNILAFDHAENRHILYRCDNCLK